MFGECRNYLLRPYGRLSFPNPKKPDWGRVAGDTTGTAEPSSSIPELTTECGLTRWSTWRDQPEDRSSAWFHEAECKGDRRQGRIRPMQYSAGSSRSASVRTRLFPRHRSRGDQIHKGTEQCFYLSRCFVPATRKLAVRTCAESSGCAPPILMLYSPGTIIRFPLAST